MSVEIDDENLMRLRFRFKSTLRFSLVKNKSMDIFIQDDSDDDQTVIIERDRSVSPGDSKTRAEKLKKYRSRSRTIKPCINSKHFRTNENQFNFNINFENKFTH